MSLFRFTSQTDGIHFDSWWHIPNSLNRTLFRYSLQFLELSNICSLMRRMRKMINSLCLLYGFEFPVFEYILIFSIIGIRIFDYIRLLKILSNEHFDEVIFSVNFSLKFRLNWTENFDLQFFRKIRNFSEKFGIFPKN